MVRKDITFSSSGFTLIELLLVIGIAVISITYFSQLFINDAERRTWDNFVRELLTLNRAITQSYIDRNGLWPGQMSIGALDCATMANVQGHLSSHLPDFSYQVTTVSADGVDVSDDLYKFSCANPSYYLVETTSVGSLEAADYIASYLPVAGKTGSGQEVLLMVPRPRINPGIELVSGHLDSSGEIYFNYPANCDDANVQLDIAPDNICSPTGEAIGGYRTNIKKENSNSRWKVEIEVVSDTSGSSYQAPTCGITVRGVRFCDN